MTLPGTYAGSLALTWGKPSFHYFFGLVVFFVKMLQRTLTVQTAKVCAGKSREAIVEEVSKAFSLHPVVAFQVGFDIVRVTFRDPDSCKLARNNSHVNLFGSNCVVQGGGSPPIMVHLFDFPAELGDEPVRDFFQGMEMLRACGAKDTSGVRTLRQ